MHWQLHRSIFELLACNSEVLKFQNVASCRLKRKVKLQTDITIETDITMFCTHFYTIIFQTLWTNMKKIWFVFTIKFLHSAKIFPLISMRALEIFILCQVNGIGTVSMWIHENSELFDVWMPEKDGCAEAPEKKKQK